MAVVYVDVIPPVKPTAKASKVPATENILDNKNKGMLA